MPSAGSASRAAVSAAAVTSTVSVFQPTSHASSAVDSSVCSAAATPDMSSFSQLPLHASSTLSTSSMPPSSTLPLSLDSLMAALGSMESIAMIANQLVPLLASMDLGMLMQMLQVANPALAAALSAFYLQSAVSADVQQMSTALSQMLTATNTADAPCASGVLQNEANVSIGSSSGPAEVTRATDAACCGSTASCDSFQSSIYSSASSQVDVNTLVQVDPGQRKPCRISPERNLFDTLNTCRPSSTTSSTTTERQIGDEAAVSTSGPLFYNCHLCAFRSSHRTRFAEHLSSEFCTKSMLTMTAQPSDGELTRRKRCSYCAFSTYLSEEFDQHVRIHLPSSNVSHCIYCDYVGPSVGALRLHFRRCHPTESFFCHERIVRPKSRAKSHSNGRSDTPQPESVNLDPVVKLLNLERDEISKL